MEPPESTAVSDVLAELQASWTQAEQELEAANVTCARALGSTEGLAKVAEKSGAPRLEIRESVTSGESAAWDRVSRLLQHAGFPRLPLRHADEELAACQAAAAAGAFVPPASAVREALTQVLEQYEQRGGALQGALSEAEKGAQDSAVKGMHEAAAKSKAGQLQRDKDSLETALDEAKALLKAEKASAAEAARAAERAMGALRQKVSTQAQQLRAREAETRRLMEKLSKELGERDAAQKSREKQVFQEVYRRSARPASASDSRALELIGVYEAQRKAMEGEISELRSNERRLAKELAEATNTISRKDAFRSWRTPDEGEMILRLQEAQQQADEARGEAEAAAGRGAESLRAERLRCAALQREAEVERARAEGLALDLSSRPTTAQLAEAKATIARLRAALPDPQGRVVVQGGVGGPKRQGPTVDSSEAIQRDKEVHALGLTAVHAMSSQTMVTLVQDCCRELQLTDALLLPSALRKMCRALGALPPMESFIRSACTIVLGTDATAPSRVPSTAKVLSSLKQWSHDLKQLRTLQDFLSVLSDALNARVLPGGADDPLAPEAGPKSGTLSPAQMLSQVKTLVAQEGKGLRAIETFQRADLHMELHPEDVLAKIVAHFVRLFDCRRAEGCLPKMNELYLHTHEQANFLKVLRHMLGLEPSATTHALLAALRETLDLTADLNPTDGGHADADGADGAEGEAAPEKRGWFRRKSSSGPTKEQRQEQKEENEMQAQAKDAFAKAKAAGLPLSGPADLPQYIAVAADLRKLLRTGSVLEIVPAVKDLHAELNRLKRSSTEMQALVDQLCAALAVGSADALLPRMQQLVQGGSGAGWGGS